MLLRDSSGSPNLSCLALKLKVSSLSCRLIVLDKSFLVEGQEIVQGQEFSLVLESNWSPCPGNAISEMILNAGVEKSGLGSSLSAL